MKKTLFLLILVGVLLINLVGNTGVLAINATITDSASLKPTFVSQDPDPANPASYVYLLFKVENWGNKKAENVVVELLPKYPFSLDSGVDATKELGTIRGLEVGEKAYFVKYKVRVDEDAIDGENEIELKLTYNTEYDTSFSSTKTFDVTVEDSQTDFDIIVQDSTATSTTLAIANIGANTAYSVIVRIPEQENFRVTGTSANILGNLDAGDYTLASFQIMSRNITGAFTQRPTQGQEGIPTRNVTNIPVGGQGNLVVEISYTDTLGIRRTVKKEVRLDMTGTSQIGTIIRSTQGSQFQILGGSGLMYIVIGVVGIVAIVVILKFRKRMRRKKK